jgi:hypothetical protein
MFVSYGTICVICNKVKFITIITHMLSELTHFIFYNNKYTFVTTDTTFTIKRTYFTKINTGPLTGPKYDPFRR